MDDTRKEVNQRQWTLAPIDNEPVEFWVTHTIVTKDVTLPTETVEHKWEAELVRNRSRFVVALSTTQADFDSALNELRQAIVEARNVLVEM